MDKITIKKLNSLLKKYNSLRLDSVLDYERFNIMSIIWHSTKIEGCSLTELETRVLLENNITAGGKSLTDHLMVKDHFEAFQFIRLAAIEKKKFSIAFIQEISAYVMKNTGAAINSISGNFDSSKGDIRLVQVYVDKKYFPNHKKVPHLLEQFCQQVNDKIDKVEGDDILALAADVHYNFVNIHPFADGNGRVSRLLMNYIMLYHHQPLIKIFTEDRITYINALNETEDKGNLTIFRTFTAQQYIKYLSMEIEKYTKKSGFNLMF